MLYQGKIFFVTFDSYQVNAPDSGLLILLSTKYYVTGCEVVPRHCVVVGCFMVLTCHTIRSLAVWMFYASRHPHIVAGRKRKTAVYIFILSQHFCCEKGKIRWNNVRKKMYEQKKLQQIVSHCCCMIVWCSTQYNPKNGPNGPSCCYLERKHDKRLFWLCHHWNSKSYFVIGGRISPE